MSSNPAAAPRYHTIVEVTREELLPWLQNQSSRVIPLETAEFEGAEGFQDIFPYGTDAHRYFEWMWLSGNPTHIKVQGAIYQMNPGDFCLLAPGVPHAEVYSPATLPHSSLWFNYRASSSTLHMNLFEYDSIGHGQIVQSLVVRIASVVGTLLVSLQNEIESPQSRAAQVCNSLLLVITNLVLRALETSFTVGPQGAVLSDVSYQVIDYLHRNYARDFALDEVARAVNLSTNYLATMFKQETGKTVGQTLTEIRLHHAKLLLVEDRHSVREVAAAVGFGSPEHFSRVFKNHENIAPSLYCK